MCNFPVIKKVTLISVPSSTTLKNNSDGPETTIDINIRLAEKGCRRAAACGVHDDIRSLRRVEKIIMIFITETQNNKDKTSVLFRAGPAGMVFLVALFLC